MHIKLKPIGAGTCSIIIVLLSFIWVFSYNGSCIGDTILNSIHLPAWSNGSTGIHYTVIYSILLLVPAYLIAKRYPQHLFANTSKVISFCLGLFCMIFIVVFLVYSLVT